MVVNFNSVFFSSSRYYSYHCEVGKISMYTVLSHRVQYMWLYLPADSQTGPGK